MADDDQSTVAASDAADEERRKLEEFQRQQAAQAIGQPNAIPNEPVRGTAFADRSVSQMFTARGLPVPDTANAPSANVGVLPTPEQQSQVGIGNFVDKFGDPISPTHDLAGYPNSNLGPKKFRH